MSLKHISFYLSRLFSRNQCIACPLCGKMKRKDDFSSTFVSVPEKGILPICKDCENFILALEE